MVKLVVRDKESIRLCPENFVGRRSHREDFDLTSEPGHEPELVDFDAAVQHGHFKPRRVRRAVEEVVIGLQPTFTDS